MNTNINKSIVINKPGFSWERVKMLFRFYFPSLKPQLIAYPLATFVMAVVLLLTIKNELLFGLLATLILLVVSYMLYWNPIIFTRKNYHLTETILPVSGNEKVAFYYIYTFVAIPLLVLASIALGFAVVCLVPGYYDAIINFVTESRFIGEIYNALLDYVSMPGYAMQIVLQFVEMALTALFAVMYFKKSRALMAIALTIGLSTVQGIIAGVAGFIIGIVSGPGEDVALITGGIETTMVVSNVIVVVYVAIMLYFTTRTIKHRQL